MPLENLSPDKSFQDGISAGRRNPAAADMARTRHLPQSLVQLEHDVQFQPADFVAEPQVGVPAHPVRLVRKRLHRVRPSLPESPAQAARLLDLAVERRQEFHPVSPLYADPAAVTLVKHRAAAAAVWAEEPAPLAAEVAGCGGDRDRHAVDPQTTGPLQPKLPYVEALARVVTNQLAKLRHARP